MALRLWVYLGLLYQDLLSQKQLTPSGKLPPVLPLVIYNGDQPWNAPTQIAELLETLPGLAHYQPRFEYLLLDEGRFSASQLALPGNLVAALFRLENSREPSDILNLLRLLIDWLKGPDYAELNDAFLAWLKPLLVRTRFPEERLQAIDDLYEVQTMLAERMQTWTQEWKQQGLEEGRKKGREEGREEGLEQGELRSLRRTFEKQLSRRFGTLPEHIERQIEQAEKPKLEQWLEQILEAPTLKTLFPNA